MPSRQTLRRRHRRSPLVVALYLNAALLACVLAAVLSRPGFGSVRGSTCTWCPADRGWQRPLPDAGAVRDQYLGLLRHGRGPPDALCVRVCSRAQQLLLVASRFIGHDRQLLEYNTSPSPEEVKRLVNLQNAPIRGQPGENGGGPIVPRADEPRTGTPGAPGTQQGAPAGPTGERPLDRPPQPGDKDFVPKPSDINPQG